MTKKNLLGFGPADPELPATASQAAEPEPDKSLASLFAPVRQPQPRGLGALFLTDQHRGTIETMLRAIQQGRPLIVLTGNPGTGKSTLLNGALARLREPATRVIRFDAPVRYGVLREALGTALAPGMGGGRTVLAIDRAELLPARLLRYLLLKSEAARAAGQTCNVVLVGESPLARAVRQAAVFPAPTATPPVLLSLQPFTFDETVRYVEHRVMASGYPSRQLMSARAVRIIAEGSAGLPAQADRLLDLSLKHASEQSQEWITTPVARAARAETGGQSGFQRWSAVTRNTTLAGVLAGAALIGFEVLSPEPVSGSAANPAAAGKDFAASPGSKAADGLAVNVASGDPRQIRVPGDGSSQMRSVTRLAAAGPESDQGADADRAAPGQAASRGTEDGTGSGSAQPAETPAQGQQAGRQAAAPDASDTRAASDPATNGEPSAGPASTEASQSAGSTASTASQPAPDNDAAPTAVPAQPPAAADASPPAPPPPAPDAPATARREAGSEPDSSAARVSPEMTPTSTPGTAAASATPAPDTSAAMTPGVPTTGAALPDDASAAAPKRPAATASAPTTSQPSTIQPSASEASGVAASAAQASAAPPPAVVPDPITTPAGAAAAPVKPAAPRGFAAPLDDSVIATLIRRGEAMRATGDISAARLLYDRAAEAGSAPAAMEAGRLRDPAYLAQLRAIGVAPDPTVAANWYRRAAALGNKDATAQLQRLEEAAR